MRYPAIILAALFFSGTTQAACEPDNPDEIYEIHGDGTVTDSRTGLMWKRCAEGLAGDECDTGQVSEMTWSGALEHARSCEFAGHDDWRLPNVRELQSLAERGCDASPAINQIVFPNTPSSFFWSGSPLTVYSSHAWSVSFDYGSSYHNGRYKESHVRLVRGGQSFELSEGVFDDRFEAGDD